jgi:protein phosphatase
LSDPGRRRANNEDSFLRDDDAGLYVVADGVGGHNKGEIASREAIEHFTMWLASARAQLDQGAARCERGDSEGIYEVRRALESGVQQACYMVNSMAQLDPGKRGMSTTVTALLVRGGFAVVAHVGDSRVYRLRGSEVLPITEDHTLINYKVKHGLMTAEEAETAKGKNVITRAVGHKDYVQVDTEHVDAAPGDRFLLCTDGLHGYFDSDSAVAELVGGDEIELGAHAAIAFANERGGKDNITAVIVEVVP